MTDQFLSDDGKFSIHSICSACYLPIYFWCILRNPSINFPVEVFYYFGTSFVPPGFCSSYFPAILQNKRIWQVRIGIGFSLVIIRGIRRFGIIAVCTWPQG